MTVIVLLLLLSSHQESPDRTNAQPSANGRTGLLAPKLELIGEDETMDTYDLYDPYGDDQSERGDMDMDFLEVELVRSRFTGSSFAESDIFLFKSKEIWQLWDENI